MKKKFEWLPEEYKNKKYKFIYLYDREYSEPTIRKPCEPKKEYINNVTVKSYGNNILVSDILLEIGENSPEDYELYSISEINDIELIKKEGTLNPEYDKLFEKYQKELEIYKNELVDFKKIKKIWKEWAETLKKERELSTLLHWKKKLEEKNMI